MPPRATSCRSKPWDAGLRRMYFGSDQRETVSVMGTPAFMEFVESIQSEGVTFERAATGGEAGRDRKDTLVVEVDTDSPDKHIDALDIALPRLTRRFNREFKDLAELDPASFGNDRLPVKPFSPDQTREIVFKTMPESEIDHTILLDTSGSADYRSVVAFFARQLLRDLRLVGGTTCCIRRCGILSAITCSTALSIWKIQ
jgi:type III restriction enzyme